jgi:ribosomal protein L11 methyltransferase
METCRKRSSGSCEKNGVSDRYVELSVIATGETEEALADFLFSEGSLGLVTEDLPGEPARILIRGSFSRSVPVEPLLERLRRYQESLAALGFAGAEGDVDVREIPLEDWGRKWKEGFKPLPVGRRLLIVPPWEEGPFPQERLVIWIDPAMTFGTGHHATTRMCLEAAEAFLAGWREPRGPLVLDIGTGTGILAIAAAALGASRVLAIDTDAEACEAAQSNLRRHSFSSRVEVRCGGMEVVEADSRFDLILANLDTRTLCPLFAALAQALAPRGHLVATGIPVEDENQVIAAVHASRLHILDRQAQDGWLCLAMAGPHKPAKSTPSLS